MLLHYLVKNINVRKQMINQKLQEMTATCTVYKVL